MRVGVNIPQLLPMSAALSIKFAKIVFLQWPSQLAYIQVKFCYGYFSEQRYWAKSYCWYIVVSSLDTYACTNMLMYFMKRACKTKWLYIAIMFTVQQMTSDKATDPIKLFCFIILGREVLSRSGNELNSLEGIQNRSDLWTTISYLLVSIITIMITRGG